MIGILGNVLMMMMQIGNCCDTKKVFYEIINSLFIVNHSFNFIFSSNACIFFVPNNNATTSFKCEVSDLLHWHRRRGFIDVSS